MAYRAGCETCGDYNDVLDAATVESWEAVHLAAHAGHVVSSEFYPSIVMPWTAASSTPRPATAS